MIGQTEETDGVAQLTGPLSSRFDIQILQTFDDVPITNFPITMVTLETGAPGGQRTLCEVIDDPHAGIFQPRQATDWT